MTRMRRFFLVLLCAFPLTVALGQSAQEDAGAIRKVLETQCRQWRGFVLLREADGSTKRIESSYVLTEHGDGFRGTLTVGNATMDVSIVARGGNTFVGEFGAGSFWRAVLPRDLRGKPKERTILWVGQTGAFQMLLDHEAFEFTMSGDVPQPASIAKHAVWTTAEFGRDGFRIVIGPFAITLMECLGIFSTLFFASRFVIQWIASERAKRSVVPEIFWWVSLIGSGLMIVYAIYFGRFAVLLGQLTGWIVYLRNIWLIEMHKRKTSIAEGDMPIAEAIDDSK